MKYLLQLLRWLHILKEDIKLSKAQQRVNDRIEQHELNAERYALGKP